MYRREMKSDEHVGRILEMLVAALDKTGHRLPFAEVSYDGEADRFLLVYGGATVGLLKGTAASRTEAELRELVGIVVEDFVRRRNLETYGAC